MNVTTGLVRFLCAMSIAVRASSAKSAEIVIFGTIGDGLFVEGTSAKSVKEQLDALGDVNEINVRINSPGGNFWDGLAIHNVLKHHAAKVSVRVDALAASAASIIAMAGDTITMGDGAFLMIHKASMLAAGTAENLRDGAELLDRVDAEMADIYAARTGVPRDDVTAMMTAETWLDADEAVDLGFADDRGDQRLAASADLSLLARFQHVPAQVTAMTQQNQRSNDVLTRENDRRRAIRHTFAPFVEDHRTLLDECLDDMTCTVNAARERLLAAVSARNVDIFPVAGATAVASAGGGDFVVAAADALLIRAGIAVEQPHAASGDLRHYSVAELARACLSQRGKSHASLSKAALIKAALTTSDFPAILESSMRKALRAGYESDTQSHVAWVKVTRVPDFKTASRLLLGSAPALQAVVEGGEYRYGSLSENQATLQIAKYGRLLKLTWEVLVNDDLGAFMAVPAAMGAAARRLEADHVYENVFNANAGAGQTMQDSVPLFHAGHGNLSATVGAISTSTLGAARALLRKQTALGNGGFLNLSPRFLIVPAESETLAEQVLAQATRHVSDTTATNNRRMDAVTPEWISKLQLVIEPRLSATNGFYVAAHHSQIDTVELATLEADGGEPVVEEEQEFVVDARSYKVRHSFVAKAIDWKGIVRVPAS